MRIRKILNSMLILLCSYKLHCIPYSNDIEMEKQIKIIVKPDAKIYVVPTNSLRTMFFYVVIIAVNFTSEIVYVY